MQRKSQFKLTLIRLYFLCGGIVSLAFGLIGNNLHGLQFSLWRRAVGISGGFLFIYLSLRDYLPKYRKRREELDKELDEAEKELDEIERGMKPHEPHERR